MLRAPPETALRSWSRDKTQPACAKKVGRQLEFRAVRDISDPSLAAAKRAGTSRCQPSKRSTSGLAPGLGLRLQSRSHPRQYVEGVLITTVNKDYLTKLSRSHRARSAGVAEVAGASTDSLTPPALANSRARLGSSGELDA